MLHSRCGLCTGCVGPRGTQNIRTTQVFVANPNKPDSIIDILTGNKDKLLKYLGDFHTDKGAPRELACAFVQAARPAQTQPAEVMHLTSACAAEDEQFKEEKAVIIKEISVLQPPARAGK